MTAPQDGAPDEPPKQPVLQVVSGNPAPEQVAALVAVFAAMGGGEPAAEEPVSAWSRSARASRRFPRPAPDAWRLSLRR